MKTVYLVRHGESETNAGNIMFGKSAKLTARGHEQAKFIAQRCARLPIEVIISSGFLRADETARYIVDAVAKPLEQSDLFAERRHPSFPLGRSKSEPDYVAFEEGFWNKFDDPSWRHEDAENFDDLNARAQAALQLLAGRPEKNVLVVGHGLFTKVLAAKVVFGDGLTGSECIKVLRAFRLENTGLSVFEHDPEHAGGSVWRIAVWNDHAHLADACGWPNRVDAHETRDRSLVKALNEQRASIDVFQSLYERCHSPRERGVAHDHGAVSRGSAGTALAGACLRPAFRCPMQSDEKRRHSRYASNPPRR